MHKHLLITTFAALCVTVSAADAMPVASLQNAVEQQDPQASLLQPVTFGYRHFYAPHYGYYYSPYSTIPTTAAAPIGPGNPAGAGIGTKSLALILVRQCAVTDRAPD